MLRSPSSTFSPPSPHRAESSDSSYTPIFLRNGLRADKKMRLVRLPLPSNPRLNKTRYNNTRYNNDNIQGSHHYPSHTSYPDEGSPAKSSPISHPQPSGNSDLPAKPLDQFKAAYANFNTLLESALSGNPPEPIVAPSVPKPASPVNFFFSFLLYPIKTFY